MKITIKHRFTNKILLEAEAGSIKEALERSKDANLRGAYLMGADLRGTRNLDLWWHVHHETLWEPLTEPIRNRINYIKEAKPEHERELRLKLMKPVLGEFPKDKKGWEKLHKEECGCGFDFKKKTIFTKENGFSEDGKPLPTPNHD